MIAGDWSQVSAARIPAAELARLAQLRHLSNVQVLRQDDWLWLGFPPGHPEVCQVVQPIPGAEFFLRRGADWFRLGSLVPVLEPLFHEESQTIARILSPESLAPCPPTLCPEQDRLRLRPLRGGTAQPARAIRCRLRDLQAWISSATTAELASVNGAHCGEQVLLVGDKLPWVPEAQRFWGHGVLVPLGFHLGEGITEDRIRAIVGASEQLLLLITEAGVECIPQNVLRPLTRAGLKLASLE